MVISHDHPLKSLLQPEDSPTDPKQTCFTQESEIKWRNRRLSTRCCLSSTVSASFPDGHQAVVRNVNLPEYIIQPGIGDVEIKGGGGCSPPQAGRFPTS